MGPWKLRLWIIWPSLFWGGRWKVNYKPVQTEVFRDSWYHLQISILVTVIASKTGNVHITEHLGAFVQPLLQWESNTHYIFWLCVFNLRYPACNAHVPYCHLWPVRLYIFPHYLINGTIFEKKNTKCVLIFSATVVWHISHSRKNWARYDQNCLLVFALSTRYSCPILMKLGFSAVHISFESNADSTGFRKTPKHQIWCDFDRASSLICGNKMPTRCNRGFYCRSYCLLNMFREPLCPSSGPQEYYTVVFRAVVFKLLVWCGSEGCVSGLQDAAASCQPDT